MDVMFAGATIGLLMGSVFITVGELMLFFVFKNRPPELQPILESIRPATLAMGVVAISYPTWAVIGAITGILYQISVEQAPGGGIGSPNFVFTLAVVVVAVMMAAPFAILLRSVLPGVLALTLTFAGLFGWFLPYFAA